MIKSGFEIRITPTNPERAAVISFIVIVSPRNIQAINTVKIGYIISTVMASPSGIVVHAKKKHVIPIPPTMALEYNPTFI